MVIPTIKDQIFYVFSSSQLIIFYLTLLYTSLNRNIFGIYLISIMVIKTIILNIMKKIFGKYSIGTRPSNAFNCNTFNCGGKSTSHGFPSGHMMILGIMFTIFYGNILKT